jgi:hypothetical protein
MRRLVELSEADIGIGPHPSLVACKMFMRMVAFAVGGVEEEKARRPGRSALGLIIPGHELFEFVIRPSGDDALCGRASP